MISTSSSALPSSAFTSRLRTYRGQKLTEAEIALIEYIEKEREKLRLIEDEKFQQKKFLAMKTMEESKVGQNPQVEQQQRTSTPSTDLTKKSLPASINPFALKPLKSDDDDLTFDKIAPLPHPNEVINSSQSSNTSDTAEQQPQPSETGTPGDIASLFGVKKDDLSLSSSSIKIKKRTFDEIENEDNIPINQYFSSSGIIMNESWDSLVETINKEVLLPSFR
jgi:hypothetical protein